MNAGETIGVAMIRDLRGAMERTGAEVSGFPTLTPSRNGMGAEAAATGQRERPGVAPAPAHLGSVRNVVPKHTESDSPDRLV